MTTIPTAKFVSAGDPDPDDGEGTDVTAYFARQDAESAAGFAPVLSNDDVPESERGWVHPLLKTSRRKARIDRFEPARMAEIQVTWPLPPASVRAAYDAVRDACDRYQTAMDAVDDLATDADRELAAHQAAIINATRAGKPAPKLSRTDWTTEQTVRETMMADARQAALDAQAAYHRAVKAAMPEWRADLAQRIAPARSEAVAAFRTVNRAVRSWRNAITAVTAIDLEAGAYGKSWHRSTDGPSVAQALTGLDAIANLLASDHPVTTGRHLVDGDDLAPPSWTREALALTERGFWILGQIEAAEGWAVTHWTPVEQRARFKDGLPPELAAQLRRRSFDND